MKTKSFALASVSSLLLAKTATAAFLGLEVAQYDGGDDAQSWIDNGYTGLSTFRVYALFDPGDTNGVVAVFGDGQSVLSMSSDTGFYNDDVFGGLTAPSDFRPAMIWTAEWDTYVTIGVSHDDGSPTNVSPGFATLTGGLGQDWSTNNGGWFVTPDDDDATPTPDGLHLLAQITVPSGSGYFAFGANLNLQLKDGTQIRDLHIFPAPAALVLLGLAGLTGGRRRRR